MHIARIMYTEHSPILSLGSVLTVKLNSFHRSKEKYLYKRIYYYYSDIK